MSIIPFSPNRHRYPYGKKTSVWEASCESEHRRAICDATCKMPNAKYKMLDANYKITKC